MLPSSLTVTLAITCLGLLSVAAFVWAWRAGQFANIPRQALLPLDDTENAVARPWETASQRAARIEEFGPPTDPAPGMWGGAR
jgi:cbb3-type cytochrome oxidase maturation protein